MKADNRTMSAVNATPAGPGGIRGQSLPACAGSCFAVSSGSWSGVPRRISRDWAASAEARKFISIAPGGDGGPGKPIRSPPTRIYPESGIGYVSMPWSERPMRHANVVPVIPVGLVVRVSVAMMVSVVRLVVVTIRG
jgi:hypothetical protein